MIHVDPITLSLLIGPILALVVGVVTKWHASPAIKTYVLLALSAVSAVGTQIIAAGGDFTWQSILQSFATIAALAIAAHYGVFKPTGASAKVNAATANFGIGPPALPPVAPKK